MNLSHGDLEGNKEQANTAKACEQLQEEGDDVKLNLTLPNGSTTSLTVKSGCTVAYVKLLVEKESGIAFDRQKLSCQGRVLIDPLSLVDCPGIQPGATSEVQVVEF